MSRKTWALVTGAIRNDFYFRTVLIKLCDLRARGQIQEIVVSTWEGEIDQYEDLRECLGKLQVILVETPYIDEKLEGVLNQLGYERQRTNIAKALQIIPSDCFVLRLRTDFLYMSGSIFKLISADLDLSVKKFGEFPLMQRKKFIMKLYGTHHLVFWDDRFFYGRKDDLERIFMPIAHKKISSNKGFLDNELTMGYAFQFYPFLRELWRILPFHFFDALNFYCINKDEASLNLPRIIYRAYATACVYIYTHVYLVNQDTSYDVINLIDLFRNKIYSNNVFECIAMGKLASSKAADDFKDELRKIALGLPEAERYSYEEYKELCIFAEKELGNKSLVSKYPFFVREERFLTANAFSSSEEAGLILLNKYGEPNASRRIVSLLDDSFSSVGETLYGKIKESEYPNLGVAVIKGAIFDGTNYLNAVSDYMKILYLDGSRLDINAWEHSQRYIGMKALFNDLSEDIFEALYYCMRAYRKISSVHPKLFNVYFNWISRGIRGIQWQTDLCRHNFKPYCLVQQDRNFISYMVWVLYKGSILDQFGKVELEIAKALVEIHPKENPFSGATLNQLKKHGYKELLDKILSSYPAGDFESSKFFVSNELVELQNSAKYQEVDISSLLEYANICKGGKDAEYLIKLLLKKSFGGTLQVRKEIGQEIEKLSAFLPEDSFLLRLQQLDLSGDLSVTREELFVHENFVLLLEILRVKDTLKTNEPMLRKLQEGKTLNLLLLELFLQLEDNQNFCFFSLKNGEEIWLYYVPYLQCEYNEKLPVPRNAAGMTWPWADEDNSVALAAYIKSIEQGLYLSVELCSSNKEEVRRLSKSIVGNKSPIHFGDTEIMYLKQVMLSMEGEIKPVVSTALELFAEIGAQVVTAIEKKV